MSFPSTADGIDPIRAAHISARIDRLPAVATVWRLVALLSIGGFFELYDLFQTAYISPGLISDGIFHTGSQGVFGFSDQAAFASAPLSLNYAINTRPTLSSWSAKLPATVDWPM